MIGKFVEVIIDRPLGSVHPNHKDIVYGVNYGFVPNILGGDGEEQDAYVLGVDKPIEKFKGKIIAIIHRKEDCETKWVVAPAGMTFSAKEILEKVHFQERYFTVSIEI